MYNTNTAELKQRKQDHLDEAEKIALGIFERWGEELTNEVLIHIRKCILDRRELKLCQLKEESQNIEALCKQLYS